MAVARGRHALSGKKLNNASISNEAGGARLLLTGRQPDRGSGDVLFFSLYFDQARGVGNTGRQQQSPLVPDRVVPQQQ